MSKFSSKQTLEPEVNDNVTSNLESPAIKDALKLISENLTPKTQQDARNRAIQDLFESGFEIKDPSGARKINTKKLYQAIWKAANRFKPLDFSVHATQRPEYIEELATDGIGTVLKKGGYDASFRDKGGKVINFLLYGDAFTLIGARGEKGFPIEFTPVTNTNIYVSTRATGMRRGNKPVTKAAVIFSGTWGEFVALFPEAKNKAGLGKIPREGNLERETDQTTDQTFNNDGKLIEWCYFFDIQNKNYTLFAGRQCTILEEKSGDEYPYVFKDEEGREVPYIPLSHYMCMPSSEGFYNHGIGSMIYDLAVLYQRIFNLMAGHVEDNTYPMQIINVPQDEAETFFEKLEMAQRMRAHGQKGYVAMEFDPMNPNAVASSQSLTTQSLMNEAQLLFERIDLELKRMGIHLDEPESPNATATQVLADEENANGFAKQVMEFNASEVEFEINLTIDFIKKFVKKNDKTPLNITTQVDVEGMDMRVDGLTLGMLKDELTMHNYFVKVNSRSGAIPSNTMRRAQLHQLLPLVQPGTPESAQIIKSLAKLDDIDLAQVAPAAGVPQPSSAEMPPPPTATDRLTINPRAASQVAAI